MKSVTCPNCLYSFEYTYYKPECPNCGMKGRIWYLCPECKNLINTKPVRIEIQCEKCSYQGKIGDFEEVFVKRSPLDFKYL